MIERPILFNGEMVRAILDGRKTQTRRPVHKDIASAIVGAGENVLYRCPLGQAGDRLWVRETFQPFVDAYDIDCMPNIDYQTGKGYKISYPATDGIDEFQDIDSGDIKSTCKPSIHMPRWASRITLEITDIRVEPVQEIIEDDALAEGCEISGWLPSYSDPDNASCAETKWATDHFAELWNSIYKNWDENPWVWVIEFRMVEK